MTAAAMNVTIVEVDDAMSVFSSASREGVVDDGCCAADESGTAEAPPDKACDALFDCTTVTCGDWSADMM
ncbi:hypothetical protein SAMN05192539_104141 [Paraburkholderia diazotrophica]|uniref:Uncharacterized protein n=1 Tax=Paraburkholderia diazotrophica TaxID=667676 RepID=A0A1H7E8W2_9BURK|nr:hypothetical protein SAMN05192539_104141 [Paraburkholderia diazotrophica]